MPNAPGELRPTGNNTTHLHKAGAVGRQLHYLSRKDRRVRQKNDYLYVFEKSWRKRMGVEPTIEGVSPDHWI